MSKRVYRSNSVTSRHTVKQHLGMVADAAIVPDVLPQYLPESARELRQRVQRAIQRGDYACAIAILNLNRDLLETMSEQLLTDEVLEGEPLKLLLAQAQTPVNSQIWLATGQS